MASTVMASTVMASLRLSPRPADAGFSLVELLLAAALGLCLSGVMLQSLLSDGQTNQRLSRLQFPRATLLLTRCDRCCLRWELMVAYFTKKMEGSFLWWLVLPIARHSYIFV